MSDLIDSEEEVKIENNEDKLTDWANEPTLKDLMHDYTGAKDEHQRVVSRIDSYLDARNMTGKHAVKHKTGDSSIAPKVIRKQSEWAYSSLTAPYLGTPDIFNGSPATHLDVKAAKQNTLVLNHQFNNRIDKVKFINDYVRTAVDEGTVIVKISWEYEDEITQVQEMQYEYYTTTNPEEQQLVMGAAEQLQQGADLPKHIIEAVKLTQEKQQAVWFSETGLATVKKTRIIKNQPHYEVCGYKQVVIDPTCKGVLTDAKFIVYMYKVDEATLKKRGYYQNLDKLKTSNQDISHLTDEELIQRDNENFAYKDKPRKEMVCHEYWGYWDIAGDGVLKPIVAEWVDDVLIRLALSPMPFHELPFEVESYLPVRKSLYGEYIGVLIEDNQKIVGAALRGIVDVLGKSANGQTAHRAGALDATNRRRYKAGADYDVNTSGSLRDSMYMHTYPEVPQSAYTMMGTQIGDAESLTGFGNVTGSNNVAQSPTAAGVNGALSVISERKSNILNRLSNGLIKIARKTIALNAIFLEEEETVRITDSEFVQVKREDLEGRVDIRVTVSTLEEDNSKAQELAFMLQTLGNNVDFGILKIIFRKIAELRKMPELAEAISSFQPEPDPLEVRRKELEVELLEAQIRTEIAKAGSYQGAGMLSSSKADTEEAKADNIRSDTDSKDLDFVEKESGVTQERDLQKAGQQAKSNIDLKMIDHALKQDAEKAPA